MRVHAARLIISASSAIALSACLDVTPVLPSTIDQATGIRIDIIGGKGQQLDLLAGRSRFYVDQLRLQVQQLDFPTPDVVDWMAKHSTFAVLDWHGLQRVKTDWETESGPPPPTYEEVRGHLSAAWMQDEHSFTIEPVDKNGQAVSTKITVDPERFTIYRRTALSWSTGQPARGDNGGPAGNYAGLKVTSSGTFKGLNEDIYEAIVVTGGKLGETDPAARAKLVTASVRGDDRPPPPPPGPPGAGPPPLDLVMGTPIELGNNSGAFITFDGNPDTLLVAGDRWVVRVRPADLAADPPSSGVGRVEAGTRARHFAMAEVRIGDAHRHNDLLDLPPTTAALRVAWSAQPDKPFDVPVAFVESELDYGLDVRITTKPPPSGAVFMPGDEVEATVALFDNAGNLLHDEDKLPTYADFMAGKSNGIQYFNTRRTGLPSGNGYFNEARLNIMVMALAGPKHELGINYEEGPAENFIVLEHSFPIETGMVFGGFGNPKIWQAPSPTTVKFKLPPDAGAGSYALVVKAQREWLGEAAYRMRDIEIQVGSPTPTDFRSDTGNCDVCHGHDATLLHLRHGTTNHRLCAWCHQRDHGVIPEHLHAIHFSSPRFVLPRNDCSLCHLTPGSNTRASQAVCGSCHQTIHPGEPFAFETADRYSACATSCHNKEPLGHVRIPPQ